VGIAPKKNHCRCGEGREKKGRNRRKKDKYLTNIVAYVSAILTVKSRPFLRGRWQRKKSHIKYSYMPCAGGDAEVRCETEEAKEREIS